MVFIGLMAYAIPIAIGIVILRWPILPAFLDNRKSNIIAITLFSLLIIAFFSLLILDYYQRSHSFQHSFCEQVEIELQAVELDSFQDYQVDFELTVNTPSGSVSRKFSYWQYENYFCGIELTNEPVSKLIVHGHNIEINLSNLGVDNLEDCTGKIRINKSFEIEEGLPEVKIDSTVINVFPLK